MKLYIFRHAKSMCNEKGINASCYEQYCGGLSKEGKKQARELASELRKYNFNKIIVSPLKRAIQTLQPYLDSLEKTPKVLKMDIITERDLGDLAGTKTAEVPEYQKRHNVSDRVSWTPPNGESLVDVYKRANKFLKWLKGNCDKNDSVLICTHDMFIRTLLTAIDKGDIKNLYDLKTPENGKIIFREI